VARTRDRPGLENIVKMINTTRRAALAFGTALIVWPVQAGASTAAPAVTCGGLEATIVGTEGDDYIVGTSGDDVIAGLDGTDTIMGRAGNDVICGDGGLANSLYGERGDDTLIVVTIGRLDGGLGGDVLDASAAPPGVAQAYFGDARAAVTVDLRDGTATGAGHDTLIGLSDVWGSAFDDRLIGNADDNMIRAGAGDDRIRGLGGADSLYADDGIDRLTGGDGDDFLSGGAGTDRLIGGLGDDGARGNGDTDWYRGGPGDDRLLEDDVDSGDDHLSGGSGSDDLAGGFGDDFANGGADFDSCFRDIETKINCEA
jgi:Ca2+-binding RTX toxin-like protein